MNAAEGETEHRQGHQEVKHALQDPGGQLGGHRDLFFAGDQVRPDEFAGPAEQGNGGKADYRGAEQVRYGGPGFEGAQKHRPAKGPSVVAGEGRNQGQRQPLPAQILHAGGQQFPVERTRGQLRMHQPCQTGERNEPGSQPFPRRTANVSPLPATGPKKLAYRKN